MAIINKKTYIILLLLATILQVTATAKTITVGPKFAIKTIKKAIKQCYDNDTIIVDGGIYQEGNIIIDKSLTLLGKNNPIIDGQKKQEVISIKANFVILDGFTIKNSGYGTLEDPCGIKVYDAWFVTISNNILDDNFFSIYIQYGKHCIIKNNTITAYGKEEQEIGNGIHCWKSDSIQIIGNKINGHRDGIYLEFVTGSIIWRNISSNNFRYGLHFMFSNNDTYISNVFKNNGAGVGVMFTKGVKMINNWFEDNWGDASYGLLLKEISDSYIFNNRFLANTTGIFMEGTNRIEMQNNSFKDNGWGMKIQASCMDNKIINNNFLGNTFDVSTNGSVVLNEFIQNYWDKYEGYDLNRDNIGDVPYHPLSLFSVIVEINPPVMLLFKSFFITMLEKSEKILPSLTPENFIDNQPLMRAIKL